MMAMAGNGEKVMGTLNRGDTLEKHQEDIKEE